MSQDLTLHQRRREPKAEELAGIPWLSWLSDSERGQTVPRIVVGDAQTGDAVAGLPTAGLLEDLNALVALEDIALGPEGAGSAETAML